MTPNSHDADTPTDENSPTNVYRCDADPPSDSTVWVKSRIDAAPRGNFLILYPDVDDAESDHEWIQSDTWEHTVDMI